MKNIIKKAVAIAACGFLSTFLFAQTDGAVDTAFNPHDHGYMHFGGSSPHCIVIQPDQKILAESTYLNDTMSFLNHDLLGVVRYMPDGTMDGSFETSTLSFVDAGMVENICMSATAGKIYVAGYFNYINSLPNTNGLVRFNGNKTLDNTFNPGTGPAHGSYATLVKEMPNGQVLSGGNFTSYSGVQRNSIIKLNANGSIDTTFNAGLTITHNQGINVMLVQPDGRILIASGADSLYTLPFVCHHMARLLSTGQLDTTFNTGTGPNGAVMDMLLQADGKIIVRGKFTSFNGTPVTGIVRVDTNGGLDNSFAVTVPYHTPLINDYPSDFASALAPDGSFYLNGVFNINGRVITVQHFFATGQADTNFRFNAYMPLDTPPTFFALAVQSDGKLVASVQDLNGCINGRPRKGIARFMLNGDVDTTFLKLTGANSTVTDMARMPDGRIVLAGNFTGYNDMPAQGLVRIYPDGAIDTSFNSPFGRTTVRFINPYRVIALQPDGKVLLAGDSFYMPQSARICRLNMDGSIDTTFKIAGSTTNGVIYSVLVQPDGKILVGGWFTIYNGTPRNGVARLNSDGSIDTAFVFIQNGLYGLVRSMALQPDAKIVAGGQYGMSLMRINTDGSLDTAFQRSGPDITKLIVDTDGKIVYTGFSTEGINRLNANGTMDTAFLNNSSGGITSYDGGDLERQSDGNYLETGNMNVFGRYFGIIRYLPNNYIDTTFVSNPGAWPWYIYKALVLPDNNVMIAGDFYSFNGVGRNGVARLHVTITPHISIVPAQYMITCSGKAFYLNYATTYDFNAGNVFTAELSDSTGSFASPTIVGSLAGVSTDSMLVTMPFETNPNNSYLIRIVASNPPVNGSTNAIYINPAHTQTINATICHGSSYTFGNANLTQTGVYNDTSLSWRSCDSITTLQLTVLNTVPVITRTGDSLSTTTFNSYQWFYNGNPITGATSPVYVATHNGTYTVAVTDDNSCADTSANTQVTGVSVFEPGTTPASFLYPNPVNGNVTVEIDWPEAMIAIYDIQGQLITTQKSTGAKTTINTTGYGAGIYLVTIECNGTQERLKMVVE